MGVVHLVVDADAYVKRKPTGRHVKKKIKPTHADEVQVEEGQVEEEEEEKEVQPIVVPRGPARAYPTIPLHTAKRVAVVSEVASILYRFHHESGHPGVDTTFANLSTYYVGMSRSLCKAYVLRCTDCKERFSCSAPPPRVLTAIPTEGFLDHQQADCISFVDRRTGFMDPRVELIPPQPDDTELRTVL